MTKNHLRILIVFLLLVGNGLLNSTIASQRIFITDNRGVSTPIFEQFKNRVFHCYLLLTC